MAECFNCHKKVVEDEAHCFGCGSLICEECNINMDMPWGAHSKSLHLIEGD